MNPPEPPILPFSPLLPSFLFYPNPRKDNLPPSDPATVNFSQLGLIFCPPICQKKNIDFNMISTVLVRFREDLKLFEVLIYFMETERKFCHSPQKFIKIIKIYHENEYQAKEFRWKVLNEGEPKKEYQDLGIQLLEKKNILVFVNPIGGKGQARMIFRNARPILGLLILYFF